MPPARVLQVITVARNILRDAERFRNLPPGVAPPNLTEAEILLRCRPKEPKPKEEKPLEWTGWYARWLAYSTYYLTPESSGWDEALSMLLAKAKLQQAESGT